MNTIVFILSEILIKNSDLSFITWKEFEDLNNIGFCDKILENCNLKDIKVENSKAKDIKVENSKIKDIKVENLKIKVENSKVKNMKVESSAQLKVNNKNKFNNELKVFVKNLSFDTNRSDIYNIFTNLGYIQIYMMKDKTTQKFNGTSILTFQSKEFSNSALKFNGSILKNKKIIVECCK